MFIAVGVNILRLVDLFDHTDGGGDGGVRSGGDRGGTVVGDSPGPGTHRKERKQVGCDHGSELQMGM